MNPVRQFLDTLFGTALESQAYHILVWTMPDKRSHWCRTVDSAVETVDRLAGDHCCYVGVALSPEAFGPSKRCPAGKTAGIVGLWADIDIAHGVHQKQNLPRTDQDALKLIDRLGLKPTLTIHSGHGLQAWWAFKEPWIFEDDQDRNRAATLAKRWNDTVARRAQEYGWKVDSVHDLARVMRIAGTVNRKGDPVPVSIIEDTGARYGPEDFTDLLMDPDQLLPCNVGSFSNILVDLDPDAAPPMDKLECLLENDPKFRASFDRKRPEFPSSSEYDMSLAVLTVLAGWTDQEIANLLIYFHSKNGDAAHLKKCTDRSGNYVARTIANARIKCARPQAVSALQSLYPEGVVTPEASETPRDKRLKLVRDALGIRVDRFLKYVGEEPCYFMEVAGKRVRVGNVETILYQHRLAGVIAGQFDLVISKLKQAVWESISQAILSLCDHVDASPEMHGHGRTRAWLDAYLSDETVYPRDDVRVSGYHPFVDDGCIHIYLDRLLHKITKGKGERETSRGLSVHLKEFGAGQQTVHYTNRHGKRTSRSYWRLPDWYPDGTPPIEVN